jgi:hypothetical protein
VSGAGSELFVSAVLFGDHQNLGACRMVLAGKKLCGNYCSDGRDADADPPPFMVVGTAEGLPLWLMSLRALSMAQLLHSLLRSRGIPRRAP